MHALMPGVMALKGNKQVFVTEDCAAAPDGIATHKSATLNAQSIGWVHQTHVRGLVTGPPWVMWRAVWEHPVESRPWPSIVQTRTTRSRKDASCPEAGHLQAATSANA